LWEWQACLAVLQNIQAIRKNRPKEELVRDSVEHEFRKQINNLNGSVSCCENAGVVVVSFVRPA